MHDRLYESNNEYQKQQQEIKEALGLASELLENRDGSKADTYFDRFDLPEKDGFHTLEIHLWAANPEAIDDPDVQARIIYSQKKEMASVEEMQKFYIIRNTPDNDYALETSVRDATATNRHTKKLFEHMAMTTLFKEAFSTLPAEEQESTKANFERTDAQATERKHKEDAAFKEELLLGLHAATPEDFTELTELLRDARRGQETNA